MNNLIPVRRMDKNGVMSTKWVTASPEASSGRGSIPAPSLPASRPDPKIYSPKYGFEIGIGQSEVSVMYSRSMIRHQTTHRLDDIDPQVLQALEYLIQDAKDRGLANQVEAEVKTAFNIVGSHLQRGSSNPYVALDNLAVFGDAVVQPGCKHDDITALVAGLEPYFEARDFLRDASDEDREKAVLLVTAASRINAPMVAARGTYYDDDRTIGIDSREMNDFILSRPDDVERIVQAVNERKSLDVGLIRGILDHGQQSLRSGLL
jgi:hypothetical protein